MRPIGLHIGLAKAASTTLQDNVFRNHPDVFYLGKKQENSELEEATTALKRYYNPNRLPPDWAQTIQNRIRKGQDRNLIPLYSDEDLSTYKFIDPDLYINRWHAIAPDARILFIIRNPIQWLTSLFYFRLTYGQDDVLLGFETWVEKFARRKQVKSSSREVFYSDIYHLYSIPKRHAVTYFELGQAEINACNQLIAHAKKNIEQNDTTVSGFNIGINNGASAGQTVFHCHIHLIPRREGDVENPRGGVRHVIPNKGIYKEN